MITLLFVAHSAHLLTAQWCSQSWLVPNFTLVGLIFVISLSPRSWLVAALVCGLLFVPWTVHHPVAMVCGYGTLGGLLFICSQVFDLQDRRIQGLLTAVSCLAVDSILLLAERQYHPHITLYVAVHVLLTTAMLPVVAFVYRKWRMRSLPKHRRAVAHDAV